MLDGTRLDWVESLGGPLLLIPDTLLEQWTGALDDEVPPEELDEHGFGGDFSRAFAVDFVGAVPLDGGAALALDGPDMTAFLPARGCLLRWQGADSEQHILDHVDEALAGAEWLERVRWRTDGDAVLCDSSISGAETRRGVWPDGGPIDFARVPLEPGEYEVRAAELSDLDEGRLSFGLVVLDRIGP